MPDFFMGKRRKKGKGKGGDGDDGSGDDCGELTGSRLRIVIGTRQPLSSLLAHGSSIRMGRFCLNDTQLRVLRQKMKAVAIPLSVENMQAIADLSPEAQLRHLPTEGWSEWAFDEGIEKYLERWYLQSV